MKQIYERNPQKKFKKETERNPIAIYQTFHNFGAGKILSEWRRM